MKTCDELHKDILWYAIDIIYPKHDDGTKPPAHCSDNSPNGSGSFGCKRCQVIVDLDKRVIKIWPRKTGKNNK